MKRSVNETAATTTHYFTQSTSGSVSFERTGGCCLVCKIKLQKDWGVIVLGLLVLKITL